MNVFTNEARYDILLTEAKDKMDKKRNKKPKYEYQILLNKKIVWHGVNAREKLAELAKKYPKMEIGIKWVPKNGVLIAKANLSI